MINNDLHQGGALLGTKRTMPCVNFAGCAHQLQEHRIQAGSILYSVTNVCFLLFIIQNIKVMSTSFVIPMVSYARTQGLVIVGGFEAFQAALQVRRFKQD